jgi:hypothetical protein
VIKEVEFGQNPSGSSHVSKYNWSEEVTAVKWAFM